MVRSSILVCALIAAAFLLIAAPCAESAVTCGTVTSSLSQCINYVRGMGPLTPACCSGCKRLAAVATTTADRQTTCKCLKSLAGSIRGVNYGLVSGIRGKCGVSVPYPISPSTDCSKVR